MSKLRSRKRSSSIPANRAMNSAGPATRKRKNSRLFRRRTRRAWPVTGGVRPEESKAVEKIKTICFYCHAQLGTPAQVLTGKKVSLISPAEYAKTPHAKVACVVCHLQASESGHGKDIHGDCRQCHLTYHDEKVAHDLHALVACGSCHLQGTKAERDPKSKHVIWKREFKPGQVSRVHEMAIQDKDASCRHCHIPDNQIGAASMILPAKSIICMPCHAGTFSVGDTTTLLTLIAFIAGMVMVFSYVLTGASSDGKNAGALANFFGLLGGAIRALFSKRIGAILKALFLDVLLQRRLYRQSPKRWLIHSLIFYPFAFRFVWGVIGLVGSLWKPEWTWVWPMLNKNSPATAFLFDLTGIMLIVGLLLAYLRGQKQRSGQTPGFAPSGPSGPWSDRGHRGCRLHSRRHANCHDRIPRRLFLCLRGILDRSVVFHRVVPCKRLWLGMVCSRRFDRRLHRLSAFQQAASYHCEPLCFDGECSKSKTGRKGQRNKGTKVTEGSKRTKQNRNTWIHRHKDRKTAFSGSCEPHCRLCHLWSLN